MKDSMSPYKFKQGEFVRIILDMNLIYEEENKIIKGIHNSSITNDDSIDIMQGYMIVKSTKNFPLATTSKNGKRGMVREILQFNSKNLCVKNGASSKISIRYLVGIKVNSL